MSLLSLDKVSFDYTRDRRTLRDVSFTLERGGSLGLLSMHERISLTGGSLELKSSAQDGTRISAVFPTTVSPLPH